MAADLPGAPPPALLCWLFSLQMCRLSSMCYDVFKKVFSPLEKHSFSMEGNKGKTFFLLGFCEAER